MQTQSTRAGYSNRVKVERFIERGECLNALHPDNKFILLSYVNELEVYKSITDGHKYNLLKAITDFMSCIRSGILFSDLTDADIMRSVANHKTTITNSDSTRRGKITYYKQFLKWLVDEGHNQHITRAKIEKITSPQIRPLKTEKDILTHAELEQVLTSAETMRDRVMLMTLYESAGRADEIRLLTWQEVIFFDNYVDITLQSKTEHKRRIPLYLSYLLLKKWKQVLNPTSDDSYVFPLKLKEPYKPFSYDGFLEMVKRTVKRAEVQKKVTPHTFRHTRVTNLLQDGLSEQSVKLLAWGTEHTTMLKTYAHLTHADAKNELHRLYGMNSASSYHGGRSITKPVHCPACDTVNPKINHICAACGAALIQSL